MIYKEKAAAMGRKIQEEHGVRAACAAIEKQLQTKKG
jgi:hypothetical protein